MDVITIMQRRVRKPGLRTTTESSWQHQPLRAGMVSACLCRKTRNEASSPKTKACLPKRRSAVLEVFLAASDTATIRSSRCRCPGEIADHHHPDHRLLVDQRGGDPAAAVTRYFHGQSLRGQLFALLRQLPGIFSRKLTMGSTCGAANFKTSLMSAPSWRRMPPALIGGRSGPHRPDEFRATCKVSHNLSEFIRRDHCVLT